MELEIIKREIELLKIRSPMTDSAFCTNNASDACASTKTGLVQSKVNINTIAALLSEFDDTTGDFRMWQNQLKLLEQTYRLNVHENIDRIAAARKSFGLAAFEDRTYGTVYEGFTRWIKDYVQPPDQ
jgi:hypothetical protein